ncbi:MAG: sigma-70 family RNA polymerase sigma factor [Bacteroidota bacterium]
MDEKKLVAQVISGSESAFRVLIGKYERLVTHMVARAVQEDMDREEICQDVFIKVYEKISTFNFESKLSTWIATIAFRTAVNFAKKKKMNLVDIDTSLKHVGDLDDSFEKNDLGSYVKELIEKLPVNYKLVLTLFYIEGFSYPDIVEITEMPEGTVKNYLHRAKAKLKKIIEEQGKKELEWI